MVKEKNLRRFLYGGMSMMKQIKCMICMGILLSLVHVGQGEDWTQLGHDTHHTYSSELSVPKNLELKWQYQTRKYNESSPAVVEDRVYIFDRETLYCLALDTGELLFEVPAYAKCPSTPTVADGKIYLASDVNHFQCLDASTGTVLWGKKLPELHWVNPLVDDTALYVTVDNLTYSSPMGFPILDCMMVPQWLTLLALDKDTGEEIWRYSVPDDSSFDVSGVGFPVLVHGTLLFHVNYYEDEESFLSFREKSDFVCIDADTGSLKWKHEGVILSAPIELDSITPAWITYYENRIYMSCKGYVMAADMETWGRVWEYDLSQGWDAFFSVGYGVVVANGEDSTSCLDVKTGQKLWEIPGIWGSRMPVITEEDVFIGSFDGTLYRIHTESGEIIWSDYVGGTVFSPVVAHEHVLVVANDNTLYCFGPSRTPFKIGLAIAAVILVLVLLLLLKKINRI
jgi:outer membrane protein assembly factor BamB